MTDNSFYTVGPNVYWRKSKREAALCRNEDEAKQLCAMLNEVAAKETAKAEHQDAIDNAKGWLETIREMVADVGRANVAEDVGTPGYPLETTLNRIHASVFSVMVRDGWRQPGEGLAFSEPAEEFEILLTTGGPGLRLWGTLKDGQPEEVQLQWQGWGTPWTEYTEARKHTDTLRTFASQFWFGE